MSGGGLIRRCIYCGATGPVKATACPRCGGRGLEGIRRDLFGAVCDLPASERLAWLRGYVEGTDLPEFRSPSTRRGRLAAEARRWLSELEATARDADTASPEELEAASEILDRARAADVCGVYGTRRGNVLTLCGRDGAAIGSTRWEPVTHPSRGGPGPASEYPRISCPDCLRTLGATS